MYIKHINVIEQYISYFYSPVLMVLLLNYFIVVEGLADIVDTNCSQTYVWVQ